MREREKSLGFRSMEKDSGTERRIHEKKRKNGVEAHIAQKECTNRSILNRDSLFFSTVVTFLIHVKPSVAVEAHMYT